VSVTKITIRERIRPAGLNIFKVMCKPPESSLSREVPGLAEPRDSENINESISDGGTVATR